MSVKILRDRCKGCGYCAWICPNKCLETSKERNKSYAYPIQYIPNSICTKCGLCEEICPDFAIWVVK